MNWMSFLLGMSAGVVITIVILSLASIAESVERRLP